MRAADAFPYPDDDPGTVRNLGTSVSGVSDSVDTATSTTEGVRATLASRWSSPAGGRAVTEVDLVTTLSTTAVGALADAQAPLDDYARALDDARSTIDSLRTQYDGIEADHQSTLDDLAERGLLDGHQGNLLVEQAMTARGSRIGELEGLYDEAIGTLGIKAKGVGAALIEIAGRVSPAPQSLDGDLVRAHLLDALPFMAAHTGTSVIRTDDRIIVDTSDGDDDVRITHDPDTGEVVITVDDVPYRFDEEEAEDIVVRTNGGNDVVEVLPGTELGFELLSGTGDDLVAGAEGNDVLYAGVGDDIVVGGEGDDDVDGGIGRDTLQDSSVMLVGGSGLAIRSRSGGGDDLFVGGTDDDTIDAGGGNDEVDGGHGDDAIDGHQGNDTLRGGYGDDTIDAGGGNDEVDGGYGDDAIHAGGGNDEVDGGYGDDAIRAGGGDDCVEGGHGNDYVDGYLGDDTLRGGAGDDVISGGVGDDAIGGGRGADVIYTGAGRDTVADRHGANTVYHQGDDTLSVDDRTQRVTVEIAYTPWNIHVEGSPEFQARVLADLETLASSPTGKEMLQQLGEEGSVPWGDHLTIRETTDLNGYASSDGNDAAIEYNPSFSNPVPISLLFHELAHTYDFMSDNMMGVDDGATWYLGPDAAEAPAGVDADGDGRITFDEVDCDDDGDIDDDDLDLNGDGTVDEEDGWLENLEREAVGLPVDHDGNPDTPDVPADQVVDHPGSLTENALREEMGLPRRHSYR